MKVNHVVSQEQVCSLRFKCVYSLSIDNKYNRRFAIVCYSWQIVLYTGLDVSFENIQSWKGIREEAGEVNTSSTKYYKTDDETRSEFSTGVTLLSYTIYLLNTCNSLYVK